MNDLSTQQIGRLATVILVLGLMIAGVVNAESTTFIIFEGYESGQGAPPGPEGGVIASQGTGPQEPWFGDYAYWYLDGWNHNPRVDPSQYQGVWASGGHAGTGVEASGWFSLDCTNPSRYVFDFQGYEFDHCLYYEEPSHPKYGHEERWYKRMQGGAEGTWQILDTDTDPVTTIARGTLGDSLYMDIFYDPDNAGTPAVWDPYMEATGTLIAEDDGGAFYDDLMIRSGSNVMDFTALSEEPPSQAQNPGAPLNETWAIYGINKFTITLVGPITRVGSIKVDADAPGPVHDGTSWATAYTNLQDGLAAAEHSGVEIWVAQGTYKPDQGVDPDQDGGQTPGDRTAAFRFQGQTAKGGYAGYGEADPDARHIKLYKTTLSGDIGDQGDTTDNSYHVVEFHGGSLDGFTITGGNANGDNTNGGDWEKNDAGGGLYVDPGEGTVSSCIFTGNSADRGGGIANIESYLNLINCSFVGNSATYEGGGMYNKVGSAADITGCTFTGNSAPSGTSIFNADDGSDTNLTNCILWDDSTGLYAFGVDTTVNFSNVKGGWAGTGNIDADPLFADAEGRLSAGSPCIDAGDSSAVPAGVTTDLDGNPRIINGIVDMGAYESPFEPATGGYKVDADAPGPVHNGASWATAYNYLQNALAAASSGDEIWVAQGTYKPDQGGGQTLGDRTATFQLKNGVAIYGGYAGFGEPDPDARDADAYETILSGDIGAAGINTDNSYHVVTGSGTGATAALDGFTVTAGHANGWDWERYGGGMYNDSGSPTVTNCTFSSNSASYDGGGMYNKNGSSPTVTDCTFSGNSADDGGGMSNSNSSPTLTNCTFSGNSTDYGDGGGMYNKNGSSPTVTDCTFSGNFADGSQGGGICNDESSPTITNCTFSGNNADRGGGMSNYYDDSQPTIINCTFLENTAWEGGGIYNYCGRPTIINCVFSGNSASRYYGYDAEGGGIHSTDCDSSIITNCLFSGNIAEDDGGGIYSSQSYTSITNCTFSGNSAKYGGGISIGDDTITNCILWGNTDIGGSDESAQIGGGTPVVSYSCVQGWSGSLGGTGNIGANPMFFDANNPDPNLRDYHLRPGSPCIDTGDNNSIPADTVDLDNDGNTAEPIPFDIDTDVRVSGGTVDMGSDEAIWDGATGIGQGGSVTLNPGGGADDPNTEALVVFDNNSVSDANITVVEMSSDPHPPSGGFEGLGTTLRIETTLADGEFFMTMVIPFDFNDLDGKDPLLVDLMYYDANSSSYMLAVAGNTGPVGTRWVEEAPTDAAPTLATLNGRPLGDYGVYWNAGTQTGYVWANVDHSTDFGSVVWLRGDIEPDGDVDFADFAAFAAKWLDSLCGICGRADLTGDGDVGWDDLRQFTDNWLTGVE